MDLGSISSSCTAVESVSLKKTKKLLYSSSGYLQKFAPHKILSTTQESQRYEIVIRHHPPQRSGFKSLLKNLFQSTQLSTGYAYREGMCFLETDVSMFLISGIQHQEQEWKGRTVIRLIAYENKDDTGKKNIVRQKQKFLR